MTTTEGKMRLAAIGAAIAGGAIIAAITTGDDPRGGNRGEFFETAVALRERGLDASAAKSAIRTQSGASQADVDDIIAKSYHSEGRDERSLRTQPVTLLVANVGAQRAFQEWGSAWCEPLSGMPQYVRCVSENSITQGVPLCALGLPAGFVARVQTTPAFAAKLGSLVILGDGAAEIQRRGWAPCPES